MKKLPEDATFSMDKTCSKTDVRQRSPLRIGKSQKRGHSIKGGEHRTRKGGTGSGEAETL